MFEPRNPHLTTPCDGNDFTWRLYDVCLFVADLHLLIGDKSNRKKEVADFLKTYTPGDVLVVERLRLIIPMLYREVYQELYGSFTAEKGKTKFSSNLCN